MRTAPLFLFLAMPCLAQVSSTIALSNGVRLSVATSLGQGAIAASMSPASGNSFYRIFRDQTGLAVFVYELAIERTEGSEFRLTARPAGDEFARKFPAADGGKPAPTLPADRVVAVMHSGDRVPMEVFELPGAGAKVIDTVELKVDPEGRSAPEDGGMRLSGLKVSINRELVPPGSSGSVAGRFTMFYVPGRGGYFMSASPQPSSGFVQAGWIDGTRMQFTMENQTFDCVADAPILPGHDRGEVWVYHDPHYAPSGHWTDPLGTPVASKSPPVFFIASSNTLNWWIVSNISNF